MKDYSVIRKGQVIHSTNSLQHARCKASGVHGELWVNFSETDSLRLQHSDGRRTLGGMAYDMGRPGHKHGH